MDALVCRGPRTFHRTGHGAAARLTIRPSVVVVLDVEDERDWWALLMERAPHTLHDVLTPPPAWQGDAACVAADPAMFFPDPGQTPGDAKRLCAVCPVARQCLDYALDLEQVEGSMPGVWGGLSTGERRHRLETRTAAA